MADNDRHLDELEHPESGHELHDINAIVVTRFGIGLTILCIAVLFLMWGLFSIFMKEEGGPFTPAPPLSTAATQGVKVPPQPRLEERPRVDLADVRAGEDHQLNSYGWVDQGKGVVRIPVARAMEILAQRGLPARSQQPPPAGSQNNPTQSSGGTILQQPGGPLAPELGTGSVQPAVSAPANATPAAAPPPAASPGEGHSSVTPPANASPSTGLPAAAPARPSEGTKK